MKIPVLTLACVLGFAALKGQAQESTRSTIRDPKVNVGIKAGFNSSMYFLSEFSVFPNRNLKQHTQRKHICPSYKRQYIIPVRKWSGQDQNTLDRPACIIRI